MSRGEDTPRIHARLRSRVGAGPALVIAGCVTFVLLTVLAPGPLRAWTAKEGPLEHMSHVVLAIGVVALWVRACRPVAMPGGRAAVCGLALAFTVVLAEELDWGAVIGVHAIADRLHAWTGRRNLHNAWHGGSYVLFAAPVLAIVALGLSRGGPARARPRMPGWLGPGPSDAVGLLVVGAASLLLTLALAAWEPQFDEVAELFAYGLVVRATTRGPRESR